MAMTDNPFSSVWLRYPEDQRDDYVRYCRTETRASVSNSPFRRRVDMWFASMALAARRGLEPSDLSGQKTVEFIQGEIFNQDTWRVQAVMMVALTKEGSIDVVGDPARMMEIANGLAAAGEPLIAEMLTEGQGYPFTNLSRALEDELLDSNR